MKKFGITRKLLSKYGNIRFIPIIVYCKDPTCSASKDLIVKLRSLSFVNITTFKSGLSAYFDLN